MEMLHPVTKLPTCTCKFTDGAFNIGHGPRCQFLVQTLLISQGDFVRILLGVCQDFALILLGFCKQFAKMLPGFCQDFARILL